MVDQLPPVWVGGRHGDHGVERSLAPGWSQDCKAPERIALRSNRLLRSSLSILPFIKCSIENKNGHRNCCEELRLLEREQSHRPGSSCVCPPRFLQVSCLFYDISSLKPRTLTRFDWIDSLPRWLCRNKVGIHGLDRAGAPSP